MWCFTRGYTPAQASEIISISEDNARKLMDRLEKIVAANMEKLNAEVQLGMPGEHQDCEIDEVAFRRVVDKVDGVPREKWLRYIAAARRGSSKMSEWWVSLNTFSSESNSPPKSYVEIKRRRRRIFAHVHSATFL